MPTTNGAKCHKWPTTNRRLLFDAIPRPTFVYDRETLRFSYVNAATCAYYGWTREEMLAMTIRDLETGPAKHVTKDGRVLDVEVDVTHVTFQGRAACLVGVREAEVAARRFQMLVEHSADGLTIIDDRGVIVYMSPAAERALGVEHGDLVGKHAMTETHPDDASNVVRPRPGETRTYVTRIRHRDGSWRWMESTTANLTHDPGVRAFVSSFRDVTQLRRSETNFRTLIERTPTLVLVHREGIVRYVNPRMVALLGYDSASDLVGANVLDRVHPEDLPLVRARIERAVVDGGTSTAVSRIRRRDGTYVAIEVESIILDFDGESSIVVLGRDLSERNEMFARLAVADRLVSVGTLAAGVAHEINNPISYVMSNLSVIADELDALIDGESRLSRAEVTTLITDAQEGVARVSAIVRNLRALSRNDDVSTEPVDVALVLSSSIKMVSNEARHRARLVTSIADGLPTVTANASRLGQVFVNLLVNAAHAIDEGRPRENEIRIRAFARDAQVVIEVEDTGVGIPPSVLGRIFDPFFTTKPIGVGTGLGLAISHEIVRSFGGNITVESTPGRGSVFRVILPVSEGSVATTPPAKSKAPVVATARVLMVDDQISMGRSTRILMSRHYDITPITRAQEALARINGGEHYDAIVCDLMMPEMSGVELFEQLTRVAPEYAKRVVFITGGAFTEQAREFLATTTQPHVEKPFTEETLRNAIERVRSPVTTELPPSELLS